MKRASKARYILYGLIFVGLFWSVSSFVTRLSQKPMRLTKVAEVIDDKQIESSNIYPDSFVAWDENLLKFYSLEGEVLSEILGNGHFSKVYYTKDKVMLYDSQLGVLYNYTPKGDLIDKDNLDKNVFGLIVDDKDIYTHTIIDTEPRVEEINLYKNDKEEIYTTDKFIIDFVNLGREKAVFELASENFSYRSTVTILGGKEPVVYNFDNETALDITRISRNRYLLLTNKHLYGLKNGEKEKTEMTELRDYIMEKDRCVVLERDQLNIYDKNLELIESHDLNNPQGIDSAEGGYFVHGATDMVGFIGQEREFRRTFDSVIYDVENFRDYFLIGHKNWVVLYKLEEIKN